MIPAEWLHHLAGFVRVLSDLSEIDAIKELGPIFPRGMHRDGFMAVGA
jgi:hypothetical protein